MPTFYLHLCFLLSFSLSLDFFGSNRLDYIIHTFIVFLVVFLHAFLFALSSFSSFQFFSVFSFHLFDGYTIYGYFPAPFYVLLIVGVSSFRGFVVRCYSNFFYLSLLPFLVPFVFRTCVYFSVSPRNYVFFMLFM